MHKFPAMNNLLCHKCSTVERIDYRCEDCWFLVARSSVTSSNSHSLSSTETGVNLGLRSWKTDLSEWAQCQKAISVIYSTKKWRTETQQLGLIFDRFKAQHVNSGTLICFSWLNGSFFGEGDLLTAGVKTNLLSPMLPLNSAFLLSSRL